MDKISHCSHFNLINLPGIIIFINILIFISLVHKRKMFGKKKEEAPSKEDFSSLKGQFEDGSLKKDVMGTSGNHCCAFVDLEVGIWSLGAFQIITAVGTIYSTIFACCFFMYFKGMETDRLIFLAFFLVWQIPSWLGAIYYGRFFMKSEKKNLPKAHLLNIVTIVLTCLWATVGSDVFFEYPMIYPGVGGAKAGTGLKSSKIYLYNFMGAFCLCICQAHWFNCAKKF